MKCLLPAFCCFCMQGNLSENLRRAVSLVLRQGEEGGRDDCLIVGVRGQVSQQTQNLLVLAVLQADNRGDADARVDSALGHLLKKRLRFFTATLSEQGNSTLLQSLADAGISFENRSSGS